MNAILIAKESLQRLRQYAGEFLPGQNGQPRPEFAAPYCTQNAIPSFEIAVLLFTPGLAAVRGPPGCTGIRADAALQCGVEVDGNDSAVLKLTGGAQHDLVPVLAAVGGMEQGTIAAAGPDIIARHRNHAERHWLLGQDARPGTPSQGAL